MLVKFKLTIPNVNSWNGRWSGENKKYILIRRLPKSQEDKALRIIGKGYFHYNFGDGWSAGIYAEQVDSKDAAKFRKISDGFNGYDWMVESIIENEVILPE